MVPFRILLQRCAPAHSSLSQSKLFLLVGADDVLTNRRFFIIAVVCNGEFVCLDRDVVTNNEPGWEDGKTYESQSASRFWRAKMRKLT